MTDAEQVRALVTSLARQHPSLVYACRQLRGIARDASDGTLDPVTAGVLRELVKALENYAMVLEAASRA